MVKNAGGHRGTDLRMGPNLIKSQEESGNHFNSHKAYRVRPGKPLAEGFLAAYRNKDLGGIADGLVSFWEHLKADSPGYQIVERSITSANTISGGLLVRSHLKR